MSIENILTLDICNKKNVVYQPYYTLGNSTANHVLPLSDRGSASVDPWIRSQTRVLWDNVPAKSYKGNMFLTLNPDPNCEWYTTHTDKKLLVTKYLSLIQYLKDTHKIKSSVSVYEYGKEGKKNGKLHFHAVLRTEEKDQVENAILKEFNQRSNAKHRTLNIKIIKKVADRENMIAYLKKEQQNKKKCLYYN